MQFPPRPCNNCVPTIVLCKYLLAIALIRIVYHLSLCKIVTKVNYNMFQSQSFRMWWSHAATTKMNDCRNYTCIRKTQTNQSCGSAGGIQFLIVLKHDTFILLKPRKSHIHLSTKPRSPTYTWEKNNRYNDHDWIRSCIRDILHSFKYVLKTLMLWTFLKHLMGIQMCWALIFWSTLWWALIPILLHIRV